ncbi:hypothetical protein Rsub_01531 [Raphidocelis subcapitata]|uniref:Uncharacterized protein n=1 Tax=Raphidocelis subcapitata TaxID=307507 RepID=A0A2V0NQY2_9CHLO|nr:hypothetical protein Rsub_01531 [Raphidocelis subcapitata]|eukprot:GBF89032.1 hypothetical protein Rsub_01531 [Raphidocelis subcapitata]
MAAPECEAGELIDLGDLELRGRAPAAADDADDDGDIYAGLCDDGEIDRRLQRDRLGELEARVAAQGEEVARLRQQLAAANQTAERLAVERAVLLTNISSVFLTARREIKWRSDELQAARREVHQLKAAARSGGGSGGGGGGKSGGGGGAGSGTGRRVAGGPAWAQLPQQGHQPQQLLPPPPCQQQPWPQPQPQERLPAPSAPQQQAQQPQLSPAPQHAKQQEQNRNPRPHNATPSRCERQGGAVASSGDGRSGGESGRGGGQGGSGRGDGRGGWGERCGEGRDRDARQRGLGDRGSTGRDQRQFERPQCRDGPGEKPRESAGGGGGGREGGHGGRAPLRESNAPAGRKRSRSPRGRGDHSPRKR